MLTPTTCHDAPGKVMWTPKMLEAFSHLRSVLCAVCVLNVPGPEDIFVLQTDASAGGVGAVFNVVRDDKVLPVAFFSKQLQGAERRYSATQLEGLAVYRSVTFFAHFLYGREFTLYTDHQALVSMRSGKVLNRRVHGWSQAPGFLLSDHLQMWCGECQRGWALQTGSSGGRRGRAPDQRGGMWGRNPHGYRTFL